MNPSNGYLYKINIIIKLNYTFIKINIESFRFDSTTVLQIRDEMANFLVRGQIPRFVQFGDPCWIFL